MAARPIARVLLDSPLPQLDRLFDYAIPPSCDDEAIPGVRVKVPLRSAGRMVPGFIVTRGWETDQDRTLSEIDSVVSVAEVLPKRLYALARAVSDRAAGSAIDIVRLAIPRRMVRAEKSWLAREPTGERQSVTAEGLAAAREVMGLYDGLADQVASRERLALDVVPGALASRPGWAQTMAAAATLTLDRGESSILIVPDHRDLRLLLGALSTMAPESAIVRVDADQKATDRYAGYLRTLGDEPLIVVGNRSAVYSPVSRLGLLTIWDDGDALYDEPLTPYVHTRDAALIRQVHEPSALVIAGHSRSADVQRLVQLGYVQECRMTRPRSPRVIIDAPRGDGEIATRLPSQSYRAIREAAADGPVLVQVARPGYAPTLVCASCRSSVHCRECAGPMTAPSRGASPTCSWCGRTERTWSCGQCSGTTLRWASSGTERTAAHLGRAFPGAKIIVSDGTHPVLEVTDEPCVVVATRGAEPWCDSGYRAVLLLDGDRMLQAPSLRIGESCLRWWSNAAALAAPGAPVHLVGVTGPVARALASWTQAAYAREELRSRAEVQLPPAMRMAMVEGTRASVHEALGTLRADVPEIAVDAVLGPVDIGDPNDQRVRALVRFDYARGAAVAASLRSSVVASAMTASRRRRPTTKETARTRPRNTRSTVAELRVRMDPMTVELSDD